MRSLSSLSTSWMHKYLAEEFKAFQTVTATRLKEPGSLNDHVEKIASIPPDLQMYFDINEK